MAHSPNALIECAQLGYQLRGPFVLITTQIVDSFHSLRRGLQLIFANANPLVLKPYKLVSDEGNAALLWGAPGLAPSLSAEPKVNSAFKLHGHTAHRNQEAQAAVWEAQETQFYPTSQS